MVVDTGRLLAIEDFTFTAMAVTEDLHHSGMPLVLITNENSSAFGTVYYLNQDNPVPNCPNSCAPFHARRTSMQGAGSKGQFISVK